jgi:fibro-slime domain-containing protein
MELAQARACSNNPPVRRRTLAGSGSALVVALLLAACGARTELSAETCDALGAERACTTGCGEGVQVCRAGLWQACEPLIDTRACADECGTGTQSCLDGAWQTCVVPELARACATVCGAGQEVCRAGAWSGCDAPRPKPPLLRGTIRDFVTKDPALRHPDFEADYPSMVETDILLPLLDARDKPVYAATSGGTKTTSNAKNFSRWYNENLPGQFRTLDLPLAASQAQPGSFEFSNDAFFPIDGELLGNEDRRHNYHFTLEAHTEFRYLGGEVFYFAGDDDMWVFINRRIAIDLGGTHQRAEREIPLDDLAQSHGLTIGGTFPLHFFFAERHTFASTFTLRTTIADPGRCD